MNAPTAGRWAALVLALIIVVLVTPLWLPLFGTLLAVEDPLQPADAALVLEGTSSVALEAAELWRRQGVVRNVVVVEAPIETHALVAYWTDFVRWGVATPPPTPSDSLRVVRAASARARDQALAAEPVLREMGSRTVVAPGGGTIGSRLVADQLRDIFEPLGISVRLIGQRDGRRDPARWWTDGDDRRAVLDGWLHLLLPVLSGQGVGSRS